MIVPGRGPGYHTPSLLRPQLHGGTLPPPPDTPEGWKVLCKVYDHLSRSLTWF